MLTSLLVAAALPAAAPISLHPDNPRYFLFRGAPTVLITSAEHYGAVLNLDFQAEPYLDELAADGFNLTRVFVGSYVEHYGAFNITQNTLAPAPGRFICPWARSDQPGYAAEGNRFDLTKWDEDYFARLRRFCELASERGIVVEVVLFCPFYGDEQWNLSPMKASNNVNGIGDMGREEPYTMKDAALLAVQDAMTVRVVQSLRDFDNVYFEICNEPYFGGVTLEWQAHIASVIDGAERGMAAKHLIAQNIANGSAKVDNPDPLVSLLNFHYASPPTAVAENAHLGRAIGFDETGFRGTADLPYRKDGWHFILAGGGLYNHLDYSFTAQHPDGTYQFPEKQPGGGGKTLRAALRVLRDFVNGFDFVRMEPSNEIVGGVPEGVVVRVLAQQGAAYAVYVDGKAPGGFTLDLPKGTYRVEWVDVMTGSVAASHRVEHGGGACRVEPPAYSDDIALRVVRD